MSGLEVHGSAAGLGKLNHGFEPDKLYMTSSTMSSSQSMEQESRMSSSVDFEPETKPDLISSSNFGKSWTHSRDSHPSRKTTSQPGKTKQGKKRRKMIISIAVIVLLILLTVAVVVVSVYFTVFKQRSEGRQPTFVPTTHTPETHTPETHTPQTTNHTTRIVAPRMRQNSTVTTPPLESKTIQEEEESLCGVVRTGSTGRIVGGTAVARGVYPWVVSVYIDGALQCAGSIIDAEHVITAAHCLEHVRRTEAMTRCRIVAGTHLINNSTLNNVQSISVWAFYRHANFNQDTPTSYDSYLNDIAVLRLSRPLTFDTFVSPVCLPNASSRLPSRCTVVGWGATSTNPVIYPDELREVTLRTYNSSECKENFNRHFRLLNDDISYYLSDGVMCAANGSSGGLDACTGDSGGALFCREEDQRTDRERYTQFGVVSWGEGCAEAGSPGFYAYLPYFATWLKEVAKPALAGR